MFGSHTKLKVHVESCRVVRSAMPREFTHGLVWCQVTSPGLPRAGLIELTGISTRQACTIWPVLGNPGLVTNDAGQIHPWIGLASVVTGPGLSRTCLIERPMNHRVSLL
ncbi:unnamed protein product [Nesidiocoris tenuis]|uniref:Uncharacterized protein n=1 Tax=Nesidiocoris tenuis TaxID=355587 RepID=A0A6H5G3B5_9HEMI|nr:unnamed protein product [Nesidiocoris tenuis]